MVRRLRFIAALLIALAALSVPAGAARAKGRPPLLGPRTGCVRWIGTANGNDPSVRLQMRLCRHGGAVHGEVQSSSTRSGWNLREVRGQWHGDRLVLRDVRLIAQRPNPGWRFCTIDRWELTRRGSALDGRYVSSACNDHAAVHLERMARAPRPGGAANGSGAHRGRR